MIRIGIVGSDNSHAEIFSKLVNIPDANGQFAFPQVRVECIFGLEAERTNQVAQMGKIPRIVKRPEDMLHMADAVMVVFRDGDLHFLYAKPFVEAGMPVWIDKPMTRKPEEIRELLKIVNQRGALLDGGSTVKYIPAVEHIRTAYQNPQRQNGRMISATLGFTALLDNDYGGLCFYGMHLIEMTLMAFGYAPSSIAAVRNGKAISAMLNYDDIQVKLDFHPDCVACYAALFYERGYEVVPLDITDCFTRGFNVFYNVLTNKKRELSDEQIVRPVEVLAAIEKACNSETVRL